MEELYNKSLANEWIDWVETSNPQGTREKEIFPLIREWFGKLKPKTLVDLGCGQGSFSKLINNNIQYTGIDSSSTLIKRAKELYLSPNKKFVKGDIYNTSLKNDSIDSVMSIWVWSHLDNLKLAAKEMYRILNSKGRFLIITANPETYEERKTFYKDYNINGKLLTGTFDLGNGKTLPNTTLYLHSKKDIEEAIKEEGFKINYIKRIGQAESSNKGLYLVIEGLK